MKILITGANGQLGSELMKNLHDQDSELGKLPKCFANAEIVSVDVTELDITDPDAVTQFTDKAGFDLIINCAAYTNVNKCETEQEIAFKVNTLGARNLAVAAEKTRAKLIHVSTDYVFAGDGHLPYTEWDVCDPQSIYGKTKFLGEQYVRDFCSRYFIVRTAWLYGYVGNNFVKTIMKAGRERGSLKVVDDQRGNPTNAADLAFHILKIAATEEYGVYHCTGNGECSWFDFASEIIRLAGINCTVNPCTTEEFPTPARRPAYSSLDNMMLRTTVGDQMRPWQDALECFMKNFKDGDR